MDSIMTAQKKFTYTQTKTRYESFRDLSHQIAISQLNAVIPNKHGKAILRDDINIEGLTFKAQHELKRWQQDDSRRVGWSWNSVKKKYQSHPKRFELAIWYRGLTLCGVGIGKPTNSGGKIRLDYIESSPTSTSLDGLVVDITLACLRIYADFIGAHQIRIMKPINSNLRDYYLSKPGFSYNKQNNYWYLDLK